MKPMLLAAAAAAGLLCAASAQAAGLEVRFCPAKLVRTYPLQDTARVQSLLVQNVALVNRGPGDVALKSLQIELMDQGQAADTRRLPAAALEAAAKSGMRLKASGMMAAFAFQFCNGALLDGTSLSEDAVLQPGEAVIVTRQMFAYRGSRDQVKVMAEGEAAGAPVRAEASLPVSSDVSRTVFRFPLKGTWFVAVAATPHGGHRWALPEEFALDIVRLGDGTSSHKGIGAQFPDYYAYGQPVLAAADGTVIGAKDGIAEDIAAVRKPDESLEAYGQRVGQIQAGLIQSGAIAGDYVMIDHGNGEYSLYAHLKPGSVKVKAGQAIKAGEAIGALGSSGNSTEPHLHFQVCDGPDPLNCAGVPINFQGVELPYADGPRTMQAGDIVVAQ